MLKSLLRKSMPIVAGYITGLFVALVASGLGLNENLAIGIGVVIGLIVFLYLEIKNPIKK